MRPSRRLACLVLSIALVACDGREESAGGDPAVSDRADREIVLRDTDTMLLDADSMPRDTDTMPRDTAPWTAGIVDRPRPGAAAVTLVAVRAARHAEFDRVAFQFAEPGLPGIHVEYVDRPVRDCGAGHVIPIAGDGWLSIRFYPANAHDVEGRPTAGPREHAPALPIVREIVRTCDFEAVVEYVLGVESPNRYRMLELADPARIVVDVRHGRP